MQINSMWVSLKTIISYQIDPLNIANEHFFIQTKQSIYFFC